FFFFYCVIYYYVLHSFPTRRSSDLRTLAASGGIGTTTITYHVSVTDAENNVNALVSPYMGTHNQIVIVRAENQYGCVSYMTLTRSEEHTSELQSRENLVCRLLLEKK